MTHTQPMTAATPAAPPVEIYPPQTGKPLPSPQDPFYLPPAGWELTAPGTVLRRRRVRVALFGLLSLRLQAWQLLYRSTDLNGIPETTVTTVLVPRNASSASPVIAYQCAIDAVTSRAFPSYGLLPGSFGLNQTQNELMLMVAALTRGWVLSVSDHEGPQGLWMVPRQPAYHVLDGIRATLAVGGEDGIPALPLDAPAGVWGYSGGGTASTWAAQLADEYAPEINLVGALLGAPAAQPDHLVVHHNGRFAAGLIPPVIAALTHADPVLRDYLQSHLTTRGRKVLDKAARISLTESAVRWAFLKFDKLVDRPVEELLNAPEIRSFMDQMRLGQRAPKAPVYLYHGVHDQLLPIGPSDQLAEDFAAAGTHVTYRRDRASEHISLAISGGHDALEWFADRMAGTPLPTTPDVATVLSTAFTKRAIRGLLQWNWGIVKLLLGRL